MTPYDMIRIFGSSYSDMRTSTLEKLVVELQTVSADEPSRAPAAPKGLVRFVIENEPSARLCLQDIYDIDPAQWPGCGCYTGMNFLLHLAAENELSPPAPTVQELTERIHYLNDDIGCDGKRTGSHTLPSTLAFYVVKTSWEVRLSSVEVEPASDSSPAPGIVFKLKRIDKTSDTEASR